MSGRYKEAASKVRNLTDTTSQGGCLQMCETFRTLSAREGGTQICARLEFFLGCLFGGENQVLRVKNDCFSKLSAIISDSS